MELDTLSGRGNLYAGTSALGFRRDGMEIEPVVEHSLISSWDGLEKLFTHIYTDLLQVEAKDHPLLLSESAFNTRAARERLVQLVFEKVAAPACFVARDAVLASYASGRATSLVLMSGSQSTAAVPVVDGYVLQKGIVRNHAIGGDAQSKAIANHLAARNIDVVPPYEFKMRETPSGAMEPVFQRFPNTTLSYRSYRASAIIEDMKMALFSLEASREAALNPDSTESTPYQLPHHVTVEFGRDRFQVAEALFSPSCLYPHAPAAGDGPAIGTKEWLAKPGVELEPAHVVGVPGCRDDSLGVHEMIYKAIGLCDTDVRKDLWAGVVCSGGNLLHANFTRRLEAALAPIVPATVKAKVLAAEAKVERNYAPWLGGSILASLGTFHQLWMSKQEYDEHGAALVHRKCP